MFGASAVSAASSQDAAYDERGGFVVDKHGNCIRTKWMDGNDPCAPPPPPAPEPKPVVKPAPAPKPAPTPVIKLEQRTIYFGFDSAELTDEAVEKLQYIVRLINGSMAIADVHIVGYTDEMGADDYNMELSKKRAAAVENYLDQRSRMDTSVADIRGLGEAPDADTNCSNLSRSKRIECLHKQRRVEIEFKYRVQ